MGFCLTWVPFILNPLQRTVQTLFLIRKKESRPLRAWFALYPREGDRINFSVIQHPLMIKSIREDSILPLFRGIAYR